MKPGSDPLSGKDLLRLTELINARLWSKDETEIESFAAGLGQLIPFDFALAARFSFSSPTESYNTVNISYPKEWMDLYISNRFDRIDPIMRELVPSPRPAYWDDMYRKYPDAGQFIHLSRDFGLNQGYSCTLRSRDGERMTLLSLSARTMKAEPRTVQILKYALPVLDVCMQRTFSQAGSGSRKVKTLSPREREILKWVQSGKDYWEISLIMCVAHSTVESYMKSILDKLNAASPAHAVAIAIEKGLTEGT